MIQILILIEIFKLKMNLVSIVNYHIKNKMKMYGL